MKYRYERISEKTGRVVDRITVNSAEELIKCIQKIEEFLKINYKPKKKKRKAGVLKK